MRTLTIVTMMMLATTAAQANNELSLRVGASFIADDGVFMFSENNRMPQVELGYARELYRQGSWGIWGEASWSGAGARSVELFGPTLGAEAFMHTFAAGVRVERPLLPWLVPHVRAGLGVLVGVLRLREQTTTSNAVGSELSDVAAGLSAQLLLGVELLIPRRWMFTGGEGVTGGLVIEGGVTATTSLGFDIAPEQDEDLRNAPLSGSSLGSVSMSGGLFRIGAVLRF